jgi:hypothetical protein
MAAQRAQLGAILIVLAVTPRGVDLDRFLVPKELVLHATALLRSTALRRIALSRID